MPDPHVTKLFYRLKPGETRRFEAPKAVSASCPAFNVDLDAEGKLVVELIVHHPNVRAARACVEPYLRAWELQDALKRDGRQDWSFEYESSEVIDREPAAPGQARIIQLEALSTATSFGAATLTDVSPSYPAPPDDFAFSADVKDLWFLYSEMAEKRQRVTVTGYLCLSYVQRRFGGRGNAAGKLNIDDDVLKELGRLTSERGDVRSARKFDDGSTMTDLTDSETRWILAALRALILRVGELDGASQSPTPLAMSDLPSLSTLPGKRSSKKPRRKTAR